MDLSNVRVGYGYDLFHLFDISDTWSKYVVLLNTFGLCYQAIAHMWSMKFVLCVRLVFMCIRPTILTSPQIYMAVDRANEQTAQDN
jgi:hypothetical protein